MKHCKLTPKGTSCACGWHLYEPHRVDEMGTRFDVQGNVFYRVSLPGKRVIHLAPRYGNHAVDTATRIAGNRLAKLAKYPNYFDSDDDAA